MLPLKGSWRSLKKDLIRKIRGKREEEEGRKKTSVKTTESTAVIGCLVERCKQKEEKKRCY